MTGAKFFVAFVFSLLAIAFVLPTVVLLHEYGWELGHAIAALYSHTFLFYSTIGLVALAAFYSPAAIFVDFYWREVWAGPYRLAFGGLVLVLGSIYLANLLFGIGFVPKALLPSATTSVEKRVPAIFELSPETLNAAGANALGCAALARQSPMAPDMAAAAAVCKLQQVSQHAASVSSLARKCPRPDLDVLIGEQPDEGDRRYCFATREKATARECCDAQTGFRGHLADRYAGEPKHSATLTAHLVSLPFKVFFMLVVLVIGVMLMFWRGKVVNKYKFCLGRLENGVLIGASTMLFWPIANQAFLQSAGVLFGADASSAYQSLLGPAFSVVFGLWAFMIMFFFFFHLQKDVTQLVRVLGACASVVAVLKYDVIADVAVRWMGSGAPTWIYPLLAAAGLVLVGWSLTWSDRIHPSMLERPVRAAGAAVVDELESIGEPADTLADLD